MLLTTDPNGAPSGFAPDNGRHTNSPLVAGVFGTNPSEFVRQECQRLRERMRVAYDTVKVWIPKDPDTCHLLANPVRIADTALDIAFAHSKGLATETGNQEHRFQALKYLTLATVQVQKLEVLAQREPEVV